MIKESAMPNIQKPENQPPPPVDSLDDGRQKSDEEIKNEILFNRKKDSKKSPDLSKISYDDLVKQYPVKAVEIAIEKLSSHNMSGDGIGIAELLIKSKGWDFFIEHAFSLDIGEAGIEHKSYVICGLRECMHKLGNPEILPISKIEKLLQHTDNDIEWMSIKSLIDLRQRAENLDAFSGRELISIAMDNDVDFFDEKKVREEAAQIIYENPEEYYGLMEELYQGLRDMWTDYEGGPDTKIIIDIMRERENMSVEELLDSIYPVFSFNIVTKYYSHKEVGNKFVLKEDEIRKRLQKYSQANTKVFYTLMWRQELKEKEEQLIGDYFDEFNIIPALGEFASEEGKQSNEEKFGYALNSTITPISKNTLMMHSPTGRTLALIDSDKKVEEKFENTEDIMKIASFLTHTNRLGERQYSQKDTSIAACLVFWDVVPEPIKEGFKHSFEYHGFSEELENLLNYARTQHFEGIIHTASEYSPMFNHQIVDRMHEFIAKELKERVESSSPHFVGPEEFLDSINIEHGKTSVALEDLNNDISLLNFQTLKYLQSNLDFDLSLLSRKEFYSLLIYLKNSKDGDGFNSIKDFVGGTDSQKDKFNRIKSFISLESGQLSGEQILDIGEELKGDPNSANKLFAEYAGIVDRTSQDIDNLVKIYNGIFINRPIDRDKASNAILQKAFVLLKDAAVKLKTYPEEYKENLVDGLISGIKREEKVKRSAIKNLAKMSQELNRLCEAVDLKAFHGDNIDVEETKKLQEQKKQKIMDRLKKENPDFYRQQLKLQVEYGHKLNIYDKDRISSLLELTEHQLSGDMESFEYVDNLLKLQDDVLIVKKEYEDKKRQLVEMIKSDKTKIKSLKNILLLRENLEKSLHSIIYNEEGIKNGSEDNSEKEFLSGNIEKNRDKQDLSAKLEGSLSGKLFQKYQEIINQTKVTKDQIMAIFKNEKDISDDELDKITDTILKKANHLLLSYSKKIGEGEEENERELINELDNYKSNVALELSVLKGVKNLKPEDIKGMEMKKYTARTLTLDRKALEIIDDLIQRDKHGRPFIPGGSLSGIMANELEKIRVQEIMEMMEMYRRNYDKPEYKALQNKLLKSFRQRLEKGGDASKCYVYKKDGKVLSFIFYDQRNERLKYFNSFNAASETEFTGFGSRLLDKSLDIESKDCEIYGECNAAAAISAKYIGPDYGFAATRVMPDYEKTGILAFEIHKPLKNGNYNYQKLNLKELEEEYNRNQGEQVMETDKKIIKSFKANSDELINTAADLVNNQGYVLTNYKFTRDKKNVYCAFERAEA